MAEDQPTTCGAEEVVNPLASQGLAGARFGAGTEVLVRCELDMPHDGIRHRGTVALPGGKTAPVWWG